MRKEWIIAFVAVSVFSGCARTKSLTASVIVAVTTNTSEVVSFIQSGDCEKQLSREGISVQGISALPYRDTSLLDIRVAAASEKDALAAAVAAVALLKERRAADDKANAIQQMLADPRNKTESSEMDKTKAMAIAEQYPKSSIQNVESPRILK